MSIRSNHIIRRQVLDIQTGIRENAWQWQNKMRDLYYGKLISILEEALDEIDSSSHVIRIDRLTVDLGAISAQESDEDLMMRFRSDIREELKKTMLTVTGEGALSTTSSLNVKVQRLTHAGSDMDSLIYFLETGLLPWNMTSLQQVNFERILLGKVHESSFKLRLIRQLEAPYATKRLLNQFSPAAIYELIGAMFFKSDSRAQVRKKIKDLLSIQKQLTEQLSLSPFFEKNTAAAILNTLTSAGNCPRDFYNFYRIFIEAVYNSCGHQKEVVAVASLKFALTSYGKEKLKHHKEVLLFLKKEIAGLFALPTDAANPLPVVIMKTAFSKNKSIQQTIETLRGLKIREQRKPGSTEPEIREGLSKYPSSKNWANDPLQTDDWLDKTKQHEIKSIESSADAGRSEDGSKSENVPDSLKTAKGDMPKAAEFHIPVDDESGMESKAPNASDVSKTIKVDSSEEASMSETGSASGKDIDPNTQKPIQSIDDATGASESAASVHSTTEAGNKAPHNLPLDSSQNDIRLSPKVDSSTGGPDKKMTPRYQLETPRELFVSNAGLVLLWNYIPHYLKHFGLVNSGGFVNEEARHRSVHLLMYISNGHTESPEYETALAKIMCGMEVTEVLETGFVITDAEKTEAEALLQVVIKHWTVLGNSGNQALRQSFLCRKGIMVCEDDGWRLRVERSAMDVLVDRLPWQIGIIRLSWMNKPIFVGWN
jgi:hypothetical protein